MFWASAVVVVQVAGLCSRAGGGTGFYGQVWLMDDPIAKQYYPELSEG